MEARFARILSRFPLEGHPLRCERHGNGHINETYRVETDAPHAYILQKINTHVFADVDGLMENIEAVTAYLHRQNPDPRSTLTLVRPAEGGLYVRCEEGGCWRVYEFITDSLCLEQAESAEDFRQSGVAFGRFQNELAGFPAEKLHETIPRFHDTLARFEQLRQAISENRAGRLSAAQAEVDFSLYRAEEAGRLMQLRREGTLPLRVTLNDTKLNNVMFDRTTRQPLCVVDLDTVMPGLAADDYGDAIRFGASTAAEDEPDLDRVWLSLPMFEAFTQGYLSACGSRLTAPEKETLPLGAKLMTLECGIRFLADYLNGDVYFRTDRPHQNLDRARTQLKLVADMERHWAEMTETVARLSQG